MYLHMSSGEWCIPYLQKNVICGVVQLLHRWTLHIVDELVGKVTTTTHPFHCTMEEGATYDLEEVSF